MGHVKESPCSFADRDHVLFDLDGTLIDSRAGIVATYRHVFDVLLHTSFPEDEVSLQEVLAMRPAEVFTRYRHGDVEACLRHYNNYYTRHGATHVQPYSGVREMLSGLATRGFSIGIVTNKGRERAMLDLRNTGLIEIGSLTALIGAEQTVERKPHPAPLLAALGATERPADRTIYVGDGPHDVLSARSAGIASVGVSYGYYSEQALREVGADAIVARPLELLDLVDAAAGRHRRTAIGS